MMSLDERKRIKEQIEKEKGVSFEIQEIILIQVHLVCRAVIIFSRKDKFKKQVIQLLFCDAISGFGGNNMPMPFFRFHVCFTFQKTCKIQMRFISEELDFQYAAFSSRPHRTLAQVLRSFSFKVVYRQMFRSVNFNQIDNMCTQTLFHQAFC